MLSNAKQLALAARLYADDNQGRFPETLEELDRDYTQLHDLTHQGDNDRPIVWSYFGAGKKDADAKFVLIVSPRIVGPRGSAYRAIAYSDASGVMVTEAEFNAAQALHH